MNDLALAPHERIEKHLSAQGWVGISFYEDGDGRWVSKWFHPQAQGGFLLVEKFSPRSSDTPAVEVYQVVAPNQSLDETITAIDNLIRRDR